MIRGDTGSLDNSLYKNVYSDDIGVVGDEAGIIQGLYSLIPKH